MKRLLLILAVTALMMPSFAASSLAQDAASDKENSTIENESKDSKMKAADIATNILSGPPAGYKKASDLSSVPEPMPGLGTLYVDPATVPMGPYLGYDKDNKLINVIYMVSIKQLEDHKIFSNLGATLGKLEIDHTDIVFNAGHAGMTEPHYQIIQWLISNDQVEKRTSK